MTNRELIARKLAVLVEFVSRVEKRRPSHVEAFKTDFDKQDALSMAVLVAIQESIDITFHIVTDEGWGTPQSYAEGFSLLSEKKILSEALAAELSQAVGLRKRLAHGYAAIDFYRSIRF